MKPDPRQLSLFLRRGLFTATTRQGSPFALQPSPHEIRLCTTCGWQIITRRHGDGHAESESATLRTAAWRAIGNAVFNKQPY
jgi:hypothetical protein